MAYVIGLIFKTIGFYSLEKKLDLSYCVLVFFLLNPILIKSYNILKTISYLNVNS